MKVAFFVGPFPFPSTTFILDQITRLIDHGIDIDIYASKPPAISTLDKTHFTYSLGSKTTYILKDVFSLHTRFLKFPMYLKKYFKDNKTAIFRSLDFYRHGIKALSLNKFYEIATFFESKEYDIIHAHFGPIGNNVTWLNNIGVIRGKIITSFHGFDLSSYLKEMGNNVYDELFRKGDLFLPISNLWKNRLIELGCDQTKIKVHRMGVDCNLFNFIFKNIKTGQRIQILTVGRLTEKKGIQYGIEAISILLKKNKNVIYKIIGDGDLKDKLKAEVKNLGIEDRVLFLGWKKRDDVIKYLKDADIFIVPSVTARNGDMEGIPVVLLEAMATGVPVISSEHSGINELIKDGKNGFMVKEKDVLALARKIEILIDNPGLYEKLVVNARAHVEEHHNLALQTEKMIKRYENILG